MVTFRAHVPLLRTTAVLAAAALLLSGCAAATPTAPENAVSESARQAEAFPAIYEQEVAWHPCGADAESAAKFESALREAGGRVDGMVCARITAPLDWNDPANETTIGLGAVRIPATGEAAPIGTLFSNPGGPGASGIEYTIGMAISPSFAALQEQYDFLGVDPRGIGGSTPLTCAAESTIFELNLAACAEQDALAASMGTAQVARDMDLIRHLLDEDLMYYAGFSYGTAIGASYVTLFPERVGRVLLDSAWPSDWSSPLGTYQQAEAISLATVAMLQQCGTDYQLAACPPSDASALNELLSTLGREPLLATDGTAVTSRTYYGYLTSALYKLPKDRASSLDVAGRALVGDQEAIDALAAAMSGGGMKVDLSGMVVRCLSSPRDPGVMNVVRYITEHGLPELLGGPEVNDTTLKQWIDLSCDALPDSGEDHMAFTNRSEQPVLIFGITGDHATPYAGAKQLAKELGNARLVTLEGSGHIASYSGHSTCADEIANAYLLRGELPADATVCAED